MSVLSSHAWKPVVPTIQPINQVLLKPGLHHDVNSPFISRGPLRRSYHDVHSHFTSHSPVLLSKLFISSELQVFHRIKKASSSPFATSHFPHFLFFTVCVLHSSSLSIRLFLCFLWRWFVYLLAFFGGRSFFGFALASSLSIDVYYLQYLTPSWLCWSSYSYRSASDRLAGKGMTRLSFLFHPR